MTIKVKNKSSQIITAAVDHWGSGGSSGDFTIDPDREESWDRSNSLGFLLSIRSGTTSNIFYVRADSHVEIFDSGIVKDYGVPIRALTKQ